MSTEVYEIGQLNILITSVVATEEELGALRSGLLKEFGTVHGLKIDVDRMPEQRPHYSVRFNIPGPLHFDDKDLMDLLNAIPLVGWRIKYQVGPKGETPFM